MKRVVVSLGSSKKGKAIKKIQAELAKLEASGHQIRWWKLVQWNRLQVTVTT